MANTGDLHRIFIVKGTSSSTSERDAFTEVPRAVDDPSKIPHHSFSSVKTGRSVGGRPNARKPAASGDPPRLQRLRDDVADSTLTHNTDAHPTTATQSAQQQLLTLVPISPWRVDQARVFSLLTIGSLDRFSPSPGRSLESSPPNATKSNPQRPGRLLVRGPWALRRRVNTQHTGGMDTWPTRERRMVGNVAGVARAGPRGVMYRVRARAHATSDNRGTGRTKERRQWHR